MGVIFVVRSVLSTYWKTGDPLILVCAAAIALLLVRARIMMKAYARVRTTVTTIEAARKWEYRYSVGAAVILALFSIWCFVAFSRSQRSVRQLGKLLDDADLRGGNFRP